MHITISKRLWTTQCTLKTTGSQKYRKGHKHPNLSVCQLGERSLPSSGGEKLCQYVSWQRHPPNDLLEATCLGFQCGEAILSSMWRCPIVILTVDPQGCKALTMLLLDPLVAWFARIDSHDSRESGDSRESEIRVIRESCESAWRAINIGVSVANDSRESIRANRVANRSCH